MVEVTVTEGRGNLELTKRRLRTPACLTEPS